MATGGQGQQQNNSVLTQKPYKGLRLTFGIIGTLLFLAGIVLGILAATKTITDTWGGISAAVSGGLGSIITLFAWIWPFPSDTTNSPLSAAATTISPNISPTISPNISPMFNVTFSAIPDPGTVPKTTISAPQSTLSSVISNGNTPAAQTNATASTTSSPTTPASIFQFNTRLKHPAQFYGRTFERNKLVTRMLNGGATAIAGERRIGKTWLLRDVQLIAPDHPALGSGFRVGYLSGSNPKCKTLPGFITEAGAELKVIAQTYSPPSLSTLAQAVRDLSAQNIVPVLCIDEFEGFENRQEFGLNFVEGLRAMAQDDGLVLIIAGRRRLFEIVKDLTGTTSPFFNVVEQLTLRPFSLKEAEAFILDKGKQAGFDEQERAFLLESGSLYDANGHKGWPPLHLQLTGQMMLDDREQAKDTNEPEYYQIHEKAYQQDFKRRLDEQYQNLVKHS